VAPRQSKGKWHQHPLSQFVIENVKGGLTSVLVYAIFRAGEWAVEHVDVLIPIDNPASSRFLGQILSWGGAFAGAALWIVILIRTLQQFWADTRPRA
jgi:hypothetical protein